MENGYEENIADKMSALSVNQQSPKSNSSINNNNNINSDYENLYQVMKAVEAAEATIKQQVEENIRLRNELQKKIQELEKIKSDEVETKNHHSDKTWQEQSHRTYEAHCPDPSAGNHVAKTKGMDSNQLPHALILHMDQNLGSEVPEGNKMNGVLNRFAGGQAIISGSGMSQISSPSSVSLSPKGYQVDDHGAQFNISSRGLMPMAESNNSGNLWKQELALKIREREEEIMQLRKHLADYSIKESQIRNEKYVLEKRIAYMRLAFDQQQQDLVDAASKALSYRQDIIEENIRLTYALQAAQQERTTFVSSLLPLLEEYSLQPPVPDAQSIVSSVKVLFRHLQEKLALTETKLKESQYQLTPWNVDHSNMAPQSPSPSVGVALATSNKNGFELVPQPAFSHVNMPISSDGVPGWDISSHHQGDLSAGVMRKMEADDIGRYSPLASRGTEAQDTSGQGAVVHAEGYDTRRHEESTNKQVKFRDPVSSSEMVDDSEADGQHIEREPPPNWGPGSSPYGTTVDEQGTSYSPYLPPVPEDPSSSFSEDDDPLPAIEGLQISGDAFPGRELLASGYSINGTTSCNFEWVRHLEDGSVNYIEGAKQPNYLVTADDVDAYLAIEVQPLDDRKRKGELVKVFANEHRKITCDAEMLSHIEKNLSNGNISYKVSLSTGFLGIWEPATLAIKREGYSIKCSGSRGVVVTEKFTPETRVTIPYGHPTLFSIIGSDGMEHLLRSDNSSEISCSRDTIVLTLRLFIMRAAEKKKLKRKGLFFK